MKLVRGRREARFLPSRHHFALFRLAAYLRLRNAKRETADVILMIDRHQSNTETSLVSGWYVATLACLAAGTLFASLPVVPALLLGFPVALLGLEVPIVAGGLMASLWNAVARPKVNPVRMNSVFLMALFIGAAAVCSARPGWVRFAGRQVLVVLVANALAAAIVFLLKEPIARLERTVGGVESDA